MRIWSGSPKIQSGQVVDLLRYIDASGLVTLQGWPMIDCQNSSCLVPSWGQGGEAGLWSPGMIEVKRHTMRLALCLPVLCIGPVATLFMYRNGTIPYHTLPYRYKKLHIALQQLPRAPRRNRALDSCGGAEAVTRCHRPIGSQEYRTPQSKLLFCRLPDEDTS